VLAEHNPPATQAFAGYDPRKITLGDKAAVTDLAGTPHRHHPHLHHRYGH
jgi:hypothetical protein